MNTSGAGHLLAGVYLAVNGVCSIIYLAFPQILPLAVLSNVAVLLGAVLLFLGRKHASTEDGAESRKRWAVRGFIAFLAAVALLFVFPFILGLGTLARGATYVAAYMVVGAFLLVSVSSNLYVHGDCPKSHELAAMVCLVLIILGGLALCGTMLSSVGESADEMKKMGDSEVNATVIAESVYAPSSSFFHSKWLVSPGMLLTAALHFIASRRMKEQQIKPLEPGTGGKAGSGTEDAILLGGQGSGVSQGERKGDGGWE